MTVGLFRSHIALFVLIVTASCGDNAFAQRGGAQTVDLLKLVDVDQHRVAGSWSMIEGKLQGTGNKGDRSSRLQIPFAPQGPYEVKVTARKIGETRGDLLVGLVAAGQQFFVSVGSEGGGISVNGIVGNQWEVKKPIKLDELVTIISTVAPTGIYTWVGDEKLIEYRDDPKRLKLNSISAMPNAKQLFIAIGNDSAWEITEITVGPPVGVAAPKQGAGNKTPATRTPAN